MTKQSLTQRIFHFPLTKITIGIIACVGVVSVAQIGLKALLDLLSLEKDVRNLLAGIAIALLSLGIYSLLFRFYEKRNISELSTNGIGKNLALGILIGAGLQALTIFVMYLNGSFSIVSVNSFLFILPSLGMAFTSAIFEEILLRGIIFRITEEKLGSYLALLISALIFGLLHLGNPNSSLVAALGISIQAGLMLGAAYIFSRNLWLPIAIHFAWNFTQSGIFGASTSGHVIAKSLLSTKIEGVELITGGKFGPEGSIQATILGLLASIFLMFLNHKYGKLIKPYWVK
jgi:uncharacterized protein